MKDDEPKQEYVYDRRRRRRVLLPIPPIGERIQEETWDPDIRLWIPPPSVDIVPIAYVCIAISVALALFSVLRPLFQ
jgi:hypothetical protein